MAKKKSKIASAKTAAKAETNSIVVGREAIGESLRLRVTGFCRQNARLMVTVGTYFDALYATGTLDLRRRVSLGLITEPPSVSVAVQHNGQIVSNRAIPIRPEPGSWISHQEWSTNTSSAAHLRLRVLAALHDYWNRVVPAMDAPKFISDNALCALYLTWLMVDDSAGSLRPHTSTAQALPWDGVHGRESLAREWFTAERLARWNQLLERSLGIVGVASGEDANPGTTVLFKEAAAIGDVSLLSPAREVSDGAQAASYVATRHVRFEANAVRAFDPFTQSLADINNHFRAFAACSAALVMARAGELGFLSDANWTTIHTQSRLSLEVATRCAGSIGPRLRASGVVSDVTAIEKRLGEIVAQLKLLDFHQSGVTPGDVLVGTGSGAEILALADQLVAIGASFAHITPAAEMEGAKSVKVPAHEDEPLSEHALLVAAVLCSQQPDRGLSAAEVVTAVVEMFGQSVDETTVKKGVFDALKPWGMSNKRGVGYFIPRSRRVALIARIAPALRRIFGDRAPRF